jgi:hypothetical protein
VELGRAQSTVAALRGTLADLDIDDQMTAPLYHERANPDSRSQHVMVVM